ncbi:hypothetical protein [Mycobacterium intermedium]|uniref:hypothetical protein n=1 Tax=Mycobacterium intermedium TaxID=28445 RepID=UPI001E37FEE0|nr:hypothetical protein [Mycobacterium intermedium]
MPVDVSDGLTATVWSASFVPAKSPIPGYGENGYSVAWVDTDGERLQVLVSGPRPAPGTTGRLIRTSLSDETVLLFHENPA